MDTRRKSGRTARQRVRGFSSGGREKDIQGRMPALTFLTSSDPQALLSALRAMRRARHARAEGYDPARHAALLRLIKKAPPLQAAPNRIGLKSKIR
ncbi:hypothetical protein ABLE91_18930 [Aquabacter sp. CN5-332]|uniref:hypothetical protein n=1 Tax=Aquabacter sp. CN5-332 TaxID=3156608 RepID=UPI0032B4600C